jgi:hypothetical protein
LQPTPLRNRLPSFNLPVSAARFLSAGLGILPQHNHSSTIIWHHIAMPDDLHLPVPRRQPEDINPAAIKTDLEFLMERISKLPTRQESAIDRSRLSAVVSGSSSPGSSYFGAFAFEQKGSGLF